MATQKLQVSRALAVTPSDFANIPFPATKNTGTNTAVVPNQLVDTHAGVNFYDLTIREGDIVYANSQAATVTKIVSATVLELNNDIFAVVATSYTIYQASAQTGSENDGCVLYIGTGGDLRVITHGGDDVTYAGLVAGNFYPVQILKVMSSGTLASNIIAHW